MPISITCPACTSRMTAPDTAAGKQAKCAKCGQLMAVPAPPVATILPPSPVAALAAIPVTQPPAGKAEPLDQLDQPTPVLQSAPPPPPSPRGDDLRFGQDEGPIIRRPRRSRGLGVALVVLAFVVLVPGAFVGGYFVGLSRGRQEAGEDGGSRRESRSDESGKGTEKGKGTKEPRESKASSDTKRDTKEQPTEQSGNKDPAGPDWSRAGQSYQGKDLKITLGYAVCGPIVGTEGGPYLYVKLKVENTSETKILRWGGWQGAGEAYDEHGNRLESIRFRGLVFAPPNQDGKEDPDLRGSPRASPLDDTGPETIDPRKTYTTLLYLEKVPPSSKELRLAVPVSAFDPRSKEVLYFRLPITHR
jgi:hypothetical protein